MGLPISETELAHRFGKIFESFPLLIPNNTSQAGWPDRFIQLPNSKIIAVELKTAYLNKHNYFTLINFRASQAAWMGKWVMNGGLGFLFVGVNNDKEFLGYVIITMKEWKDWLKVNSTRYYDGVTFRQSSDIKAWFRMYIDDMELQDA